MNTDEWDELGPKHFWIVRIHMVLSANDQSVLDQIAGDTIHI